MAYVQRSVSGFVLNFTASSTSRLTASAREGTSIWQRRQSSIVRKKCSDTRIWNGRSCGRFDGRPRGRLLLAIFVHFVLTKLHQAGTQEAGRWQAANSPPALTQAN